MFTLKACEMAFREAILKGNNISCPLKGLSLSTDGLKPASVGDADMTSPASVPTVGQVIQVPGTTNLRSTAGYPAGDGRIREGRLFRSDALHQLDDQGIQHLSRLGVVRVLDLRDPVELGLEPSALTSSPIELFHQPIFGEGGLVGIGSFAMDTVYRFVIEQRASNLAGAVSLIADAPEGGVLVHCTAGKDRTGLVIATVLEVLEVPREQIIADYVATERNIAGSRAEKILEAARMRFGELDNAAIEMMIGSPERGILHALDVIDERWGSAENMLLNNGMSDAQLDTLRTRLLTTN